MSAGAPRSHTRPRAASLAGTSRPGTGAGWRMHPGAPSPAGLRPPARRAGERGFTLIEVSVALAILAISLAVMLEVESASMRDADRARNITIGSLLARSKMIDVEQKLYDEGFTVGQVDDAGDFEEEGHAEYKWAYRVSEIEMDLSSLSSLCEGAGGGEEAADGGTDCESMLGSFGGAVESLTDELGRSLRLVVLTVTWPDGKHSESMTLRAMVTRQDFGLQPADLLDTQGLTEGTGGSTITPPVQNQSPFEK